MTIISTLRFITSHPLTSNSPFKAVMRFAVWQIKSRIKNEIEVDWVDGAKLVVKHGMTGATGNIYCGLHEFTDMAFVLHMLRPEDLFVDVGANIGSYTILASKVCGSRCLSVEPDSEAIKRLKLNLESNQISDLVRVEETALGSEIGTIRFTVGYDTTNRVAAGRSDEFTQEVRLSTLDSLLGEESPLLVKMDVEGFEHEVLKGSENSLNHPNLLAIITESTDSQVVSLLEKNGFSRWFYDPFARSLSKNSEYYKSNNALFLRDVDKCKKRIAEAPKRVILDDLL
ncbi:MAG: FkbM family methyltransferase [Alphaproteobacteria bacterium]|nr:FkbM family methyltransferase [Alphaproteobacteria bacterium]